MLSDYQRAVLQVMGIPVWEAQVMPQEKVSGETTGQPAAGQERAANTGRPAADGAARLAALRAQVTSSAEQADQPAASAATPAPSARSLTAEEARHAEALLKDIQLAADSVSNNQPPLEFEVGDTLARNRTRITLPQSPTALTAAQKRQLWALLWQSE